MNTCKKYQKLIELYVEGELNESDAILLQEHIKDCSDCREEYIGAQTLAVVINDSFQPQISDAQAADSVLASISQLPSIKTRSNFGLILAKIAAGFLLIAGLSLSFYAGRTSNQRKMNDLTQSSYSIKTLEGTVLVKHSNSKAWQPLAADSTIYIDDQFLSSPGSRVVFAIDEQSHIELKENSMLVLEISPDKTNLHLVHGTLDTDLASPHGPFFVTTPHGRAEALGTEFTVKVD